MKGIESKRILYLPNGVDTSLFFPMPPDSELKVRLGIPEHVFLYAGTLGYAHGLDTLIQSAEILRERLDIHFLFIGDGSDRARLERMKAEKNLSNITFRGPVPARELVKYASFATAAIVPQRNIPLFNGNRPAKLFAMTGYGKPIIFCGKGEGSDLIPEAHSGITVPPENAEALASAVIR